MTGSRVICTSPVLIAAYHVLLRLREPRHPPVALSYFFCSYSAFDRHEPEAHGTKPVVLSFNLAIKCCFDSLTMYGQCVSTLLLKTFSICQRAFRSQLSAADNDEGMFAASNGRVPLNILRSSKVK